MMGATYNYKTGEMTIDFKFVEQGYRCPLSVLPARIGSSWCSEYCNHFGGTWVNFIGPESYVLCKHPDAKDSEGCGEAIHAFYEEIRRKALCALCE